MLGQLLWCNGHGRWIVARVPVLQAELQHLQDELVCRATLDLTTSRDVRDWRHPKVTIGSHACHARDDLCVLALGLTTCLGLIGFKVGKENARMIKHLCVVFEGKLRDALSIFGFRKSGWGDAFVIVFEADTLQKMCLQV